jgi:hypothetical protein
MTEVKEISWSPQLKKAALKKLGCRFDHHEKHGFTRVYLADGFGLLVSDFGLGRGPTLAADLWRSDHTIYRTIEDFALLQHSIAAINKAGKRLRTRQGSYSFPLSKNNQKVLTVRRANDQGSDHLTKDKAIIDYGTKKNYSR